MANLMFKMGNYAGLDAAQKKAGTIYVTKDQHSMYVDISDTERIKIQGTVVAYDNLKDFGESVQPPYDSSVVYFIADKDALVRWNASANEGKGAWVRLNTPQSDLQAVIQSVETLSGSVSNLKDELDTAGTGIKARLTAVENKATQNATDIDALEVALDGEGGLKSRMTAAEGRLTTAEGDIDVVEGRLDTAEGNISGLSDRVGTAESKITALEGADTAFGNRLTTAEEDIDSLEAELNTASTGLKARMTAAEGRLTGAEGRLDTAEGKISAADDKIAALEGADTTLGNRLTTAEGKITAAEGKITTAEGKITALEGRANIAESDITGIKGRLDTAESNITGLQDELTTPTTGIKARLTAVENKATKNAEDIVTVGNRVTANETAIGDDNIAGSVKGRIKALETTASSVENRLTAAEGSISDLDTIVKASGTGLVDKMAAVENKATKNAEDIAKNVEDIAKNAEDIAKNAEDIAKNAEDIEVNKGAISDIEDQIQVINELIGNGAESGDTGNIASRLGAVEQKAADNTTAVGNLQTAVKSLQDDLNTADTGLKARMTAAEAAIEVNAGAISSLSDEVAANYALKTEVEKVEEDLTKSINDKIRAANSMVYKNSIDSFDDLPAVADNVKVGDTYVVATGFEVIDGDVITYYQAGDLIIAKGDESEETGFITENLSWDKVETGFRPELEPTLEVENNVISLVGGTNADRGTITLVSANDNLTIETEGTTVTFNMVWGSF